MRDIRLFRPDKETLSDLRGSLNVMYRTARAPQSPIEQGTKRSPRVTGGASLRGHGFSNSYNKQFLTRAGETNLYQGPSGEIFRSRPYRQPVRELKVSILSPGNACIILSAWASKHADQVLKSSCLNSKANDVYL